ncbi:MAG: hypothetical protein U0807_07030 [Candidatus Binatia bacterium]
MPAPTPEQDLERQIVDTHRRFVKAMNGRLDGMGADTKERYFVLLSELTAKLEDPDKSLRDVMQELLPEAMTLVLQEIA